MNEKAQLVISDKSLIKPIKTKLESLNCLNKLEKIKQRDDKYIIPTTLDHKSLCELFELTTDGLEIESYEPQQAALYSAIDKTMEGRFQNLVKKYCANLGYDKFAEAEVSRFVPKKWQIYKPMVLFQSNSIETDVFQKFVKDITDDDVDQFWQQVCQIFNVTHIAVNKPIIEQDNEKRIPYNLVPIYGDFGPEITERSLTSPTEEDFNKEFWCECLQNNVIQKWAPKYTMFSRGNIVEKQRVLTFDNVKDNVIVDLYSGIGYFTLHYLVNKPMMCLCWELNPWSNQGLIRSLQTQKVSYKLITPDEELNELDPNVKVYIFQEDNKNCIKRFAKLQQLAHDAIFLKRGKNVSHINLGLLPTSSLIWDETLQICELSNIPTEIHIHENCHVKELPIIMEKIRDLLVAKQILITKSVTILKLNKVKTYAPDVWHIVCDFLIQ